MFEHATSPRPPSIIGSRLAFLGLGIALLSACAAHRPGVDLPDLLTWEQRQSVLGAAEQWSFRGRIAVKAGDDGFNGKINWTQNAADFFATVGGPLGIGTVTIEGKGRTIELTDKDGVRTILADAEPELYYRFGWTIPVASLRYWALGIPDPNMPAETTIDESGRLTDLRQGDWAVEISQYRENAGQLMPRILTATNPENRVRMVVDKWSFFER